MTQAGGGATRTAQHSGAAPAPAPIIEEIASARRADRLRRRLIFAAVWIVLVGGLGVFLWNAGRWTRSSSSGAGRTSAAGIWITIVVSVLSIMLATVLAIVGALGRLSTNPVIYAVATLYVSLVRGTPLLVQIFFAYFALPQAGIVLPPIPTGILALGFNYGAYMTEIFRAGIQAVPRGQTEAAHALGMRDARDLPPDRPATGHPDRHPGYRQRVHRDDQGQLARFGHHGPGAPVASPEHRPCGVPDDPRDPHRGPRYWVLTIMFSLFQDRLERRLSKGER